MTGRAQNSAWVRVHCEDGIVGIGEASPMLGGIASLGVIARNIAPGLIGRDPLDHAVLLDTALHRLVKLGPEGALTGALAALDIALVGHQGKIVQAADLQAAWRRVADRPAVLCLDRRQWRAQRSTRCCASSRRV